MKLGRLLENLSDVKIFGDENIEITGINTRYLFNSGNLYILSDIDQISESKEIQSSGFEVVVYSDENIFKYDNIIYVLVKNINLAKAAIANSYYQNPSNDLQIIGIVGHENRFEVLMFLREVLIKAGKKVGILSSLFNAASNDLLSGGQKRFSCPVFLNKMLNEFKKMGITTVLLEVDELDIKDDVFKAIVFDYLIFTKFKKEKLQVSLKEYLKLMQEIFKYSRCAIINEDDFANEYIKKYSNSYLTYGIANEGDINAIAIHTNSTKTSFTLISKSREFRIKEKIESNVLGRENVYSLLAAYLTLYKMGISCDFITKYIGKAKIYGKMELVQNDFEIPVIIDAAKYASELVEVFEHVKSTSTGNIVVVIGADQDSTELEREEIGKVCSENANIIYITSQNLENLSFEDMASSISSGIKNAKVKVLAIKDRKEAIEKALDKLKKRDACILFGMGNNKVLRIGDTRIIVDERKIVTDFFNRKEKEEKEEK